MALRCNLIGPANKPGIFRGSVLTQFGQELFEAGVELALGAVAVKTKRNVPCRRHVLVYARRASWRDSGGPHKIENLGENPIAQQKRASRSTPRLEVSFATTLQCLGRLTTAFAAGPRASA